MGLEAGGDPTRNRQAAWIFCSRKGGKRPRRQHEGGEDKAAGQHGETRNRQQGTDRAKHDFADAGRFPTLQGQNSLMVAERRSA